MWVKSDRAAVRSSLEVVGPEVGPFVGEGAVEAFDFTVGLRSVGAGEFARRADVDQGLFPGQALAVGPCVVREDALDSGDGQAGEERGGPGHEDCVDFRVGEAGVIVDRGVEAVEAHAADRPAWRPRALWPPPSGIRSSFLTSTWTSSPGRSRS